MTRTKLVSGLLILLVVGLPATASLALAQSEGRFSLAWWTVDSGGGTSASGSYVITGTLGQPEAERVLSGGPFALQGGFWPTGEIRLVPPAGDRHIYLPLIVR